MSNVKFGPEFVVHTRSPERLRLTVPVLVSVNLSVKSGLKSYAVGFKLEPFKGLEAGPGTDSAKIVFGPATTVSSRRIHRPAHAHCRPERKPVA